MKKCTIDLWVQRQKNKPRLVGVNEQMKPFPQGVSVAGSYVYLKGNIETCKRIHRETLECLKLITPKLKGL